MASKRKRSRSESDQGNSIRTHLECSICNQDLSSEAESQVADAISNKFTDKSMLASPECGHLFHEVCLQQWLHECRERNASPTCPECRKTLNNESIRRIYGNKKTDAPVKKCNNCVPLEYQVKSLTNIVDQLKQKLVAVEEILLGSADANHERNRNAPTVGGARFHVEAISLSEDFERRNFEIEVEFMNNQDNEGDRE